MVHNSHSDLFAKISTIKSTKFLIINSNLPLEVTDTHHIHILFTMMMRINVGKKVKKKKIWKPQFVALLNMEVKKNKYSKKKRVRAKYTRYYNLVYGSEWERQKSIHYMTQFIHLSTNSHVARSCKYLQP